MSVVRRWPDNVQKRYFFSGTRKGARAALTTRSDDQTSLPLSSIRLAN
jgi:hypothetical protein